MSPFASKKCEAGEPSRSYSPSRDLFSSPLILSNLFGEDEDDEIQSSVVKDKDKDKVWSEIDLSVPYIGKLNEKECIDPEEETEQEDDLLQVAKARQWYQSSFTKENAKAVLKKNIPVLVATIIFLFFLLLLGLTVWKGKFGKDAWLTIVIVFLTFLGLIRGIATPELLMMLNTFALLIFGIVSDEEALGGFSESSTFCIATLCIVAGAIQHTGSMELVVKYILRAPPSIWQAQLRLMVPSAIMSAFINNIPQVAIQIPMLEAWCNKLQIPTSKMMIPLSWSTILGGTLCVIGTSSNLLVVSLLQSRDPTTKLPLMEVAAVGAPMMVIGIIYIVIFGRWLLPDRSNGIADLMKAPREYIVQAIVSKTCPGIGKSIRDAGLANLSSLYLIEIQRANGEVLANINCEDDIQQNDCLTFVGKLNDIGDLLTVKGILPTNHLKQQLKPNAKRILTEAIISPGSKLIGKTVRQSKFSTTYEADIIAIHREGEHVSSELITLKKGDCLLLESLTGFASRGKIPDFIVLNELGNHKKKYNKFKMIFSVFVTGLLVLLNALDVFSLLTCSLGAMFLLLLFKCISVKQAYEAVDVPLLVVIAGSFAMATAMETTGVAAELSRNLVDAFSGMGEIGPLVGLYLCTMLLTALLSNSASVALMFPIAWQMTGLSIKCRMYVLMFAASADFSTPYGYATNLMVYGPGGYHFFTNVEGKKLNLIKTRYKFLDYTKFGLPLQLLLLVICVPLSYWIYT